MTMIDPTIALGSTPAPVPLLGPLQIAQQGLTLQDLMARNQIAQGQVQLQQQQVHDQQTLASLYKQNTNPDGSIDASGIIRGLGAAGSGHLIPAFQTQQQDLASKQATTDKAKADTAGTNYDTLTKSLAASAAGIGTLLSNPNVSHDDVVHQLATQVKQGTLTLDHAQNTVADMPPPTGDAAKDSANLKQWLLQQNIKIQDASKRVDSLTPKLVPMNNGKVTTLVDQNAITNPGAVGATMRMTTTPGEDQSNSTLQRGQDMNFKTQNTTIEQTPGGYAVIHKGLDQPTSTPVINAGGGAQTLPPGSPVYKAEQQFAQMQTVAQQAKDLLNGNVTHSLIGAGVDAAGRVIGQATTGADNAAKLEALGGWLTSNVPRMEGPQSDADRKAYEAQAGKIGDSTQPISTRLAALQAVIQLQSQYAAINGGNGASPVGVQPVTVARPGTQPPAPPKPTPGNRPPLDAFNR